MSQKKIEFPKVFISYAWGTAEYQEKVLAFSASLVESGIEVILDKWNLIEGNDTYAFMERCVNDESVTNVLMLLDPLYAEKANSHTGGVGTETQIISAQIYQNVQQSKFIPIVFERDSDGNVYKPTYLQSRLHFDLSDTENYDNEFQRLVRRLYGVEAYKKPQLGKKPAWVEEPTTKNVKTTIKYDVLKQNNPVQARKNALTDFLQEIKNRISEYGTNSEGDNSDVITTYTGMKPIRDDYLLLLQYTAFVDDSSMAVSDFLEELHNDIRSGTMLNDVKSIFVHELFLYTVALFLKNKNYKSVGDMLCRAYFDTNGYSGSKCDLLDQAVREKDNQAYHSGVAQLWIENIDTSVCSKDDFVFADIICFNCSVFGQVSTDGWYWFPKTYVYENRYGRLLKSFAAKLVSQRHLIRVLPLFGYEQTSDFIDHFREIENDQRKRGLRDYRYSGCFEPAPLLCDYISSQIIGTIK